MDSPLYTHPGLYQPQAQQLWSPGPQPYPLAPNYNYSYPRATRGARIGGVNDQSDNEEGETEVSY